MCATASAAVAHDIAACLGMLCTVYDASVVVACKRVSSMRVELLPVNSVCV
jgi:hypothetical protein